MSDTLSERSDGDEMSAWPDPSVEPATPPAAGGAEPRPASTTPSPRRETVTCPDCGTSAEVTLTRRDAADFCSRCDFPLFWTPAAIQLGDRDTDESTLRRLPGTAGRLTVASATCPHCHEANPLAATECGRCGRPMVIAPAPVVVAPPPPPPAPPPEPEPRSLWWLWLLLGTTAVLLAVLVGWWVLER